ncbi:MAG: hypothetical protein JSS49_30375, partial [Planctomycetes bacterium]|nr:hypothetical protein [Planctomycetota bacterium]
CGSPCAYHGDKKNSLSLTITPEAKLLLKCHAGCRFREVIEAASLDLFNGVPIIEVYQYLDAKGKLLYEVCRTADKQFPSRMPSGEWGCGRQSVLYRLPEVLKALTDFPDTPVFICEGEKDVDRCWDEGLFPATCVRGGASGKWRPEFSKILAGRDIVILCDNDAPGLAFAHRIAKELRDAE